MWHKLLHVGQKYIIGVILVVALLLRLWRVDYPLADWHSFRQVDTASVTREFMLHNYPLEEPHYHDLGNIQSGRDNLAGYRMVELPVVNWLLAQVLRVAPVLDLVTVSRVAAALAATASVYLLYFFLKKYGRDEKLALWAAGVMAVLPWGVYFGRTVLPEPWQVLLILGALVSFGQYLERPKVGWWLLTAGALMAALLVKPTSVFIAPVLLLLAWQKYNWRCLLRPELWLLAGVSVTPLLWWRQFITAYPEGVPASDWLLNGNGIRLRPSWWRWLFYERLTKLWLGYTGIVFFGAGLLPSKEKRVEVLIYVWLAAYFAYLVIFATGNVQHDYYQFLLLPLVSVVGARGGILLWNKAKNNWSKGALVILAVMGLILAVKLNIGKWNVNNWESVYLGRVANELLPLDALVIADGEGDTTALWQTQRRGWPLAVEIEEKMARGAEYYVSVNRNELAEYLEARYEVIYDGEWGVIIDLTREK